ncbi:MAG TPA: hypothetical protein VGU43_00995 [Thermoplasmata archaeon]|nr:hypothetical protein [Thermoplasmata archaeon]
MRHALAPGPGGNAPLEAAQALAAAVGAPAPTPVAGELSNPARFPPISPLTPMLPRGPRPPEVMPELPALPAAEPLPVALRQVEEYASIARRLALDIHGLDERRAIAERSKDLSTVAALRAELFVRVAARLSEEIERSFGRRNELAALLETGTPDAELGSASEALARGDLTGTERRLRGVEDSLDTLEEEWETVRLLSLEAELVADTVRELGGDPLPALGPLSEARRRARLGDRSGAEPLLARSTLALWQLCSPLLTRELGALQSTLQQKLPPSESGPRLKLEAAEMARALAHHNYGGAVTAYRRFRDEVGRTSTASAGPAAPTH